MLRSHGVSIVETSAPKQTETTQRWKIALATSGIGAPLRTNIEFSRRGSPADCEFAAVDADLARHYEISAPLVNHYTAASAIAQKIEALALRPTPQARDVFDLHLLLTSHPHLEVTAKRAVIHKATLCAMDLSFDDFAGQVLAYLTPEHESLYQLKRTWEQMQNDVVSALERITS